MIMTPKSLLRHPDCKSSFDELLPGTEFQRMILDDGPASQNPADISKVLFCTGKVQFYFSSFMRMHHTMMTKCVVMVNVNYSGGCRISKYS